MHWRQSGLKSAGSWIRVKKISIYPGKFLKNSDFFRQFNKISIFQAIIAHLQLLLGKLFYFSSKITTFEYFQYMIRYNNISRPVHDPLRPPTVKNLGVATSQPPGLTPLFQCDQAISVSGVSTSPCDLIVKR